MTPRQFPSHPAAQAVGAAAILSLLLFGTEILTPKVWGGPPDTITWRSEYNSAYFEAKTAKRLLWIQFTGPWCPNCRRMEHDSFPQARIVEQAKASFISVKLRSDENEDLAMKFNLTGLPATVVIDPETQKILALHQGYLGPDDLGAVFGEAVVLRDKRREEAKTLLASKSKAKQDTLSPAVQTVYSDLTKQGIRADFGISNLPSALFASAVKSFGKPQGTNPITVASGKTAPLALSGYCPVSLVSTHKLVRGDSSHAVTHDGKLYRFANADMSKRFLENPDRYIPINGGKCPVAGVEREKSLPGDARYGVLYRERLYLCATSNDRNQFLQNPDRYALAHVEEHGNCPHCTRQDGSLVQGDPRFGLIRSGREYWFPNLEHRDAFLASLPKVQSTTQK